MTKNKKTRPNEAKPRFHSCSSEELLYRTFIGKTWSSRLSIKGCKDMSQKYLSNYFLEEEKLSKKRYH